MQVVHINRLDLNLLGPLDALLRERHVSRAADEVGLSQSAMSRALQRLRHTLGDELLVRGPGGYQLTPRAERIQRQLAAVMPRVESLFADEVFDPRSAAESFRLVGTDYPVSLFGPALAQRVVQQSPRSVLQLDSWRDDVISDVVSGGVDLIFIGVAPAANLRCERLFEERFVCVMSADHPLAGRASLTLEEYLRCSHVVISIEERHQGVLDQHLRALGVSRQAGLTVPYNTLAPLFVPGTPFVATLTERLAARYADDPALLVVPAPAEIDHMTLSMCWHPRLEQDPAQRWLRDSIRAVAAEV